MEWEDFEVHASLSEDVNEGWIWIRAEGRRAELESRRRVIQIIEPSETRGAVYCEALYADQFYMERFYERQVERFKLEFIENPGDKFELWLKEWNGRNLIFMSKWYRQKLGFKQPPPFRIKLGVTSGKGIKIWTWSVLANAWHPQIVVSLATFLGILSTAMGIIGIAFGLIPLKDGIHRWLPCLPICLLKTFASVLGVIGLVLFCWSIWLFLSHNRRRLS